MQKILSKLNFRQFIGILGVVLIIIIALNFLLFGRGGSTNNPTETPTETAENRPNPPSFGTDKVSSLNTILNQLPVITDTCTITIEDKDSDKPKLVIYKSDPNITIDECGASLFLKQNKFYLNDIEVIERDTGPTHEPYTNP